MALKSSKSKLLVRCAYTSNFDDGVEGEVRFEPEHLMGFSRC